MYKLQDNARDDLALPDGVPELIVPEKTQLGQPTICAFCMVT